MAQSVEIPQPLSSGATDQPDAPQSGVTAPPVPEGFSDTPPAPVGQPPVPEGFSDIPPAPKAQTPKAGLDAGTAWEAAKGAGEGLYGMAKGALDLGGREAAYLVAGQPSDETVQQMHKDVQAHKEAAYQNFREELHNGNYGKAFSALSGIFDLPRDPNDPLDEMLEQQFQSSGVSKQAMMDAAKKGDTLGVIQHGAGIMPVASQVDQAMTAFQADPSRANLKNIMIAAVPAFIPALAKGAKAGLGKVGDVVSDKASDYVAKNVQPTATPIRGVDVPVRSETPIGNAAAKIVGNDVIDKATQRTSDAVRDVVNKTGKEVIGSEADAKYSHNDRLGLNTHGDNLIEQARPVFQKVDELSKGDFSKAQAEAAKNRAAGNFAEADEWREIQKSIIDDHADALKAQGLDPDAAWSNYRKGINTKAIGDKLNKATEPVAGQPGQYRLNGEKLGKIIDTMRQVKDEKNLFTRAGYTDADVNDLAKAADTLRGQQIIPKFSTYEKFMAKSLATAIGFGHGGGLVGGLTGNLSEAAMEKLGQKFGNQIFGQAMLSQPATHALGPLADAMKTGDFVAAANQIKNLAQTDPSWWSTVTDTAKSLMKNTRGEAGAPGQVPLTPEEEQVSAHNANGGSTFSPDGEDMFGQNKYSVGSYPERTQQLDSLTPEQLKAYKIKNADVLNQPDHAVGTWKDPDTGKHTLDIAKLYDDRDEAIAAGKAANQKSIYHLGGEGEIQTGGTGEGPLPSEDAARIKSEQQAKINKKLGIGTNAHGEQMQYVNRDDAAQIPNGGASFTNMDHAVKTYDASGQKIGELAAQDTKPGEITIRSNQIYDPANQGQGRGSAQLKHLLDNVGSDTQTVKSDISTSDQARGAWEKLAKDNPRAISKKTYPDGQVQYSVDMEALRQGERRGAERTAPLGATELEDAIKNRKPVRTPFDDTTGAMDTINKDIASRLNPDMSQSEIATRRPTAVGADLTDTSGHFSNAEAMDAADKDNPSRNTQAGKPVMGYKEKMARTLADYAGIKYTDEELASPQRVINKFTNRVSDNLQWLYNQVPPEIRAKTAKWYDSAHELTKNMAKQYGVSHEQAAGVTAALSPQNPWDNNIGLAKRMMDIYKNRQDFDFTPKMEGKIAELKAVPTQSKAFNAMLDDIRGKKLNQIVDTDKDVQAVKRALWIRLYDEAHGNPVNDLYSPEGIVTGHSPDTRSWVGLDHAGKAVKILDNGSVSNINDVMGQGHKIRNFYNNIINPNSKAGHVTIDTHATAASQLQPFGAKDLEPTHTFGSSLKGTPTPPRNAATGLQGTYPVYANAYQKAATKLGILPRELQSVTWEAIKSLMGDEKKTPELKQKVKDIWTDVQNGHLTPSKARDLIKNESNGFSKPAWMSDEEWERVGPEGDDTSFEGQK